MQSRATSPESSKTSTAELAGKTATSSRATLAKPSKGRRSATQTPTNIKPATKSKKRKRKPDEDKGEDVDNAEDAAAAQDVFRRHFELSFAPLSETIASATDDEAMSDHSGGEEIKAEKEDGKHDGTANFGGSSSDDAAASNESAPTAIGGVEVVDHSVSRLAHPSAISKQALRSFMSTRPPSPSSPAPKPQAPTSSSQSKHPEDSAELVANDLALQRLLSESHLLLQESAATHPIFSPNPLTAQPPQHRHKRAKTSAGGASYNPNLFRSGKARLRATDLRLANLGAVGGSLYARPKAGRTVNTMKAIIDAEKGREVRRRRDAKESGIVLERKGGKGGARVGMEKRKK